MAWASSNWITFTGASRLTALRTHIQEVSDAITAGVSHNGERYDPAALTGYWKDLLTKEESLSQALAGGVFSVPTRRRY